MLKIDIKRYERSPLDKRIDGPLFGYTVKIEGDVNVIGLTIAHFRARRLFNMRGEDTVVLEEACGLDSRQTGCYDPWAEDKRNYVAIGSGLNTPESLESLDRNLGVHVRNYAQRVQRIVGGEVIEPVKTPRTPTSSV